jgi:ABC-type uncharacterized transport system involved in gliding motility auxiliary subunit
VFKKQFTALLFIFIHALPLANAIGLFISQWKIKLELVKRLETKSLHTISIPKKQVIWIDDNKELLVKNQLFDVKQVVAETDEIITVTGLYDNEEDAIWNKVDHANNPFGDKQNLITNFLQQQLAVQQHVEFEFNKFNIYSTMKRNSVQSFSLLNLVFDKDKPPCVI